MVALAGATPSVTKTSSVAYETESPLGVPGVLDVYAPAGAGPWPVVVMFHGAGGGKGDLSKHARRVADLGFVVFSATWGAGMIPPHTPTSRPGRSSPRPPARSPSPGPTRPSTAATRRRLIVFGHSGGANTAAMVAFARPEPTAGCLGGTTLGAIDALVTWEGNWILSVPRRCAWTPVVAADPRVLDVMTPWTYVPEHKDMKVVMLVSENPTEGT